MLGYGPISGDPISALLPSNGAAPETSVPRDPLVINRPTARSQGFVHVAQNLLTTTLAVVVASAPFIPQQFQQPKPVVKVQQPQQVANLNVTTLAAVAQAPLNVYNLPSQVQIKRVNQTDSRAVPPWQLLAPFRPVDGAQSARKSSVQDGGQQNLLPLQSVVTTKPFSQSDWPNPVVQKKVQQPLLTDRCEAVTTPPVSDALPFNQYDWPTPRRSTSWLASLFMDTGSYTQDLPFTAQWPEIVRKAHRQQPDTFSNLRTLQSETPAVAPFVPWQQPGRIEKPVAKQSIDPQNLLRVLTAAPPTIPTPQLDWPNPTISRKVQQPFMPDRCEAVISEPVTDLPFRQLDWQNPVIAVRVKQPDPINGVLQLLTYVPPTMPFRQAEWPNPLRQEYRVGSHALDTASYTSEVPFAPIDWPRQIIAKSVQQPLAAQDLLGTTLYVTPAAPFSQKDWPNPALRKYVNQHDQVNGEIQLLTYVAPPLPKNNSDWPNPTLPILPVQDTAQYQNPDLITPYVPPVAEPPRRGGGRPRHRKAHYEERLPSQYKRLEEMVDDVSAELAYKDIQKSAPVAVQARAATIVRPFRDAKAKVDWGRLEDDAGQVGALLSLWAAEQKRQQQLLDDDEFMMMGD